MSYQFTVPETQTYFIIVENSDITPGGAIPMGSVTVLLFVSYPSATIPFFGIQQIGLFELISAVIILISIRKRHS